MIKMKFEGGREAQEALRQLPRATQKNVVRKVLKAGAAVIADRMRELAKRRSGAVSRSIGVGTRLSRNQARLNRKMPRSDVEVYAGPGADPGAVQLEFGNAKQSPQPFARPAWEEKREEALALIGELLMPEIVKALGRYARRVARGTGRAG